MDNLSLIHGGLVAYLSKQERVVSFLCHSLKHVPSNFATFYFRTLDQCCIHHVTPVCGDSSR